MKDFGTHGESLLCDRYRELYHELNELQIIANSAALNRAAAISAGIAQITATLGYVPSA